MSSLAELQHKLSAELSSRWS